MKTILYDSENNIIIGHYPDGYKVNGKPKQVEHPIYELPYTETEPPEYNSETHYLTSAYVVDMELKQYRQAWNIVVIPPAPPLQLNISEVIKLIIKKTIDNEELTDEEILTLKTYNYETNIV